MTQTKNSPTVSGERKAYARAANFLVTVGLAVWAFAVTQDKVLDALTSGGLANVPQKAVLGAAIIAFVFAIGRAFASMMEAGPGRIIIALVCLAICAGAAAYFRNLLDIPWETFLFGASSFAGMLTQDLIESWNRIFKR